MHYLPYSLKIPFPKFSCRRSYFAFWMLNLKTLKVTPQFAPPTWNPWNGCGVHQDIHTKTRMKNNIQSASRVDRLFLSSASTGGSTDYIDQRGCLPRKHYSTRFDSRSNKDENKNQQKMKMKLKDAPLPRKRKNKFPVAVPWIFQMIYSWRFPRSPTPNRTELEWMLC